MAIHKAFLAAILVLTTASIAEADLILTVNGLDTASIPKTPCKWQPRDCRFGTKRWETTGFGGQQ